MKETNMEHFRDELLTMANEEYGIGMMNGKLIPCESIICTMCDFKTPNYCNSNFVKWLMAEYKPEIILTAREKHFVEGIETGYIARDVNGMLCFFTEKPFRLYESWKLRDGKRMTISRLLIGESFSFITKDSKEPWSVEDLRKLKVQE